MNFLCIFCAFFLWEQSFFIKRLFNSFTSIEVLEVIRSVQSAKYVMFAFRRRKSMSVRNKCRISSRSTLISLIHYFQGKCQFSMNVRSCLACRLSAIRKAKSTKKIVFLSRKPGNFSKKRSLFFATLISHILFKTSKMENKVSISNASSFYILVFVFFFSFRLNRKKCERTRKINSKRLSLFIEVK